MTFNAECYGFLLTLTIFVKQKVSVSFDLKS